MTHHRIPTLPPATDADLDTPEMAETAAIVAGGDEDLAMLSRLARMGMELAEAQWAYAMKRLAAASAEDAALKPGEEPLAAYDKISLTVRRTIALKRKIAEDIEKRRAGLDAERTRRRTRRAEDHKRTVTDAIDDALTEAFTKTYGDAGAETDEGDALWRDMLGDKENLLSDLDEFKGWLDRPVGETVARLCAALGLDPDVCVRDGDAWRVKRPPSGWQAWREAAGARTLFPFDNAVDHPVRAPP